MTEGGTIVARKEQTVSTPGAYVIEEKKENKQEIHNKLSKYKGIVNSALKKWECSHREF